MKYNYIVLLIILLISSFLNIKSDDYHLAEPLIAQKINKPDQWMVPYGFVRVDTFFDTRQVIGTGNDQKLFFPAPLCLDKLHEDINDRGQFYITAIASRLGLALNALNWKEPALSGRIEGDFRGYKINTEGCRHYGLFRLRLAYGVVKWKNWNFLFGQYWHPLFITKCYPGTVSYNKGTPFDPRARNPQLRIGYKSNFYEIIVAAITQSSYLSPGPRGRTPQYMQDAIVPNLHLQLRYFNDYSLIGIAGDYKRLVPRLVTEKCIKTTSDINSIIGEVFGTFNSKNWLISAKTIYSQNGADLDLISGYAVKYIDKKTDCRTYTPTSAISVWIDTLYKFYNHDRELGLFLGYTKNLGANTLLSLDKDSHQPIIYSLGKVGSFIDYVFRIAPRYVFAKDPLRIGFEIEYTQAAYGCPNNKATITNVHPVGNTRFLAVLIYLF